MRIPIVVNRRPMRWVWHRLDTQRIALEGDYISDLGPLYFAHHKYGDVSSIIQVLNPGYSDVLGWLDYCESPEIHDAEAASLLWREV